LLQIELYTDFCQLIACSPTRWLPICRRSAWVRKNCWQRQSQQSTDAHVPFGSSNISWTYPCLCRTNCESAFSV